MQRAGGDDDVLLMEEAQISLSAMYPSDGELLRVLLHSESAPIVAQLSTRMGVTLEVLTRMEETIWRTALARVQSRRARAVLVQKMENNENMEVVLATDDYVLVSVEDLKNELHRV